MKEILNKLKELASTSKSLQQYMARYKLQYAGARAKERLLVDALLLLCAIAIPITMLSWQDDSRQKQLTSLPISQQPYSDGWQMFKAKGLFSRTNEKHKSIYAVTQKGWTIQCGHLKQHLPRANLSQNAYTKITYQDSVVKNKDVIGVQLLCENGAQASNDKLSLTAQSLFYQSFNAGHKIMTKDPLSIKIGEATIHSARGGVIQSNGDIRLIKNVEFNAPGISINAQKQAQIKNSADKKQQIMLLEKGVLIQYKNTTKKYKGKAELVEVTSCQKKTSKVAKKCQVFGIKSLRRVMMKKEVVLQEYRIRQKNKGSINPVWTLMAQSIILQGKQARYKGGEKQPAHILFADGTKVYGEEGGHSIEDNSGILCGGVEVRLGETILQSPCLRYNLSKQQFKLETKELKKELALRFFKLNS